MSEKPPTSPTNEMTDAETALLAVLDGVDPFADAAAARAIERGDLETLGVLADASPRATPRPEAKAELWRRLGLSGQGLHAERSNPSSASREAASPSPVAASVVPFRERSAASIPEPAPRAVGSWLPLALAAAVLLAVGLGSWSGYLFSELRQSRTLVAGLESELREIEELGGASDLQATDYQRVSFENQQLRSHLAAVTKPQTKVCAMSATAPDQPEAAATAFLRPQEGEWVLAASNLNKCELGRRYRLWFLGEGGRVMGAQMLEHVNGERELELASGDLPPGTKALLVTLEFPDRVGDEPSGERVLYGDRAVDLY